MKWFRTFFYKDPEYHLRKDKSKLDANIYNKGLTKEQHIKKFHVIHFVFKYKFFVPLLLLGNKLLGKHIIKKVPKKSENRNLEIFDKAFEQAIKKWCIYYRRNSGPPQLRKSREHWLKVAKNEQFLRSIKNYTLTMYLYDTAYREYINILMHEIARGMADEYSKYPNKKTGHLFFTTDIYDVHYYVLEKAIRYNTELSVQDTEKLLNDFYMYQQMKKEAKKQ